MLTTQDGLAMYVIISSSLWVGFLSLMFLLNSDSLILSQRAKAFLLSKLAVCIIVMLTGVIFITTFNLDITLGIAAILFLLWAVFTTIIDYRRETPKSKV